MQKILIISSGYYRGEKTHLDQITTINGISFDIIANKSPKESNVKRFSFSPSSFIEVSKQIKQASYSCIHCHGFRASVFIRLLSILFKLPPIIYTIHGFHSAYQATSIKGITQILIERLLKNCQTSTICVSQSDLDSAIKLDCINKDHSTVIVNGIKLASLKTAPSPIHMFNSDDVICISSGSLEWRKGYDIIIDAAFQLKDMLNIKFIFLGSGPLQEELSNKINKLGLSKQIYMAGHQTNVAAWLQHSHIYISASRWEGLPYGILEAFQNNLPTIASNAPGIRDCITHNENGFLFELNNPNDLADKLNRLVNNNQLKSNFIKASNARLKNEFNEDIMKQKLKDIYDQFNT